MEYKSVSFKRIIPEECLVLLIFVGLIFLYSLIFDVTSSIFKTIVFITFLVLAFIAIFYIPALWKNAGYALSNNMIYIKSGCLFYKKSTISIDRIINVSVNKTPFSPILNTSTVIIRVAGTSFKIRGVLSNEAQLLMDKLLKDKISKVGNQDGI